MSNSAIRRIRTGIVLLVAVALVFTMTFSSRVIAETADTQTEEVIRLIDQIPATDSLTLSDEATVQAERHAYDGLIKEHESHEALAAKLSDENSALLQEKVGVLAAAENKIKKLKDTAVAAVADKIKMIPRLSKLKIKHNGVVQAAWKAYVNLKDKARGLGLQKYFRGKYPSKYKKLTDSRAKIMKLNRARRIAKQDAAKVVKKIKKIPKLSKLKLKHSKIVNAAKKAYKKLSSAAKKYVPAAKRKKMNKAVYRIKVFKKQVKKFRKARPKLSLAASDRLDIKVSWTKVKNAKKYIVYRKTKEKYYKIKVTKERSFIDENRYKTYKNTYKVKAVGSIGGKKVYSKHSYSLNKTLLSKATTVKATAYSGGGLCANGMSVGVGRIATDPRYIPLGTWLYVEGYGLSQACDTGGAIKGWFIDVYFTSNSTCNRWGVKYPKVYILR